MVAATVQEGWRWCDKCQDLFYALNPTLGVCAAGGAHSTTGSGHYAVVFKAPSGPGEEIVEFSATIP